jgi:methylmalonyl-CoA/ethylmalonyl-CoA epimerase
LNDFGLSFHHLGLAVKKRDIAERFARGLGYSVADGILDPIQNVILQMCTSDTMPDLEIISPTQTSGPLKLILNDADSMIYHTCYCTEDIASSLSSIRAAGFRALPVSKSCPAVLFEGRTVSFYKIPGFGLIEFLEQQTGESQCP